MAIIDARAQLEEILSKDSVEIDVRNGKTLISTVDLLSVLSVGGWFINNRGYVVRSRAAQDGNTLYLHNYLTGEKGVDHANGNKLDNRRENLRVCTQSQNSANKKVPRNNTSGYKGVARTAAGTYRAQVAKEGVIHIVGTYPDAESAARAYDDAAVGLYGEYAATNFPRDGHRWARAHMAE